MKHTPGPWYIDSIKTHANGNRRIMAEQCTPVAVVPEHLAADARLIAAAPDMLNALQRAREVLLWNLGDDSRIDAAFAAVSAAINKATYTQRTTA
jgi:hypothetical protein